MTKIKQEVRQFYDQVGWQVVSEDDSDGETWYQNARYEDLRPVSREYIRRCHLRVARHIQPNGQLLLDAGSGPVQYPVYMEYSNGYQYRVCADISIIALKEARTRVGAHGLYVVCDVANLPFKQGAFDGVVSLHTIHHLPEDEHLSAYQELYRVLAAHKSAAVVNGWPTSRLMDLFEPFVRLANRIRHRFKRLSSRSAGTTTNSSTADAEESAPGAQKKPSSLGSGPKGTFTSRHDVDWIKTEVGAFMPVEILVWRSVSVRFLRALIHPQLGGRLWLRLLYWLEERVPQYFGENGKYPLIVIRKGQEA